MALFLCYSQKFLYLSYSNIIKMSTEKTTTKRPNIRLFADRVLVRVVPKEEVTTKSGIIIPEVAQGGDVSKTEQGVVVRVSKKIENATEDAEWDKVTENEIVMYSSFAGSQIFYEGEEYKVLRITDIYGAIEQ